MPDEPLAWLITVARNALASHFRRLPPQPIDPATIDVIDLGAGANATESPDAAAIVGWGLARLRRPHAELLEAFYFDDKPVRDIALERSLSERAVEGRLRRARAKLRKQLQRLALPRATAPGRAGNGG